MALSSLSLCDSMRSKFRGDLVEKRTWRFSSGEILRILDIWPQLWINLRNVDNSLLALFIVV